MVNHFLMGASVENGLNSSEIVGLDNRGLNGGGFGRRVCLCLCLCVCLCVCVHVRGVRRTALVLYLVAHLSQDVCFHKVAVDFQNTCGHDH